MKILAYLFLLAVACVVLSPALVTLILAWPFSPRAHQDAIRARWRGVQVAAWRVVVGEAGGGR